MGRGAAVGGGQGTHGSATAETAPRSEPPTVSAAGFAYKTMRVSPTCLPDAPWAVPAQSGIVLALARSKDEAKQYVNMLVKG